MAYPTQYTVVGAGHGGKSMAAHLALMGKEVTVYNRTYAHIEILAKRRGIELDSFPAGPHGFGAIKLATSDMEEALREAEVVMLVVPSSAHADLAKVMAPHMRDGQIIILNPGRTCGAIEFDMVRRKEGSTAKIILAEAETFIYAISTVHRRGKRIEYRLEQYGGHLSPRANDPERRANRIHAR